MSRITVVLKTNEGGMWAVPQIRAMQGRGHSVTVVLPGGDGRLRRALDARGIPVAESPFGFVFRPGVGVALGLWRLRQTIARTQPDILFYHLYASALAARIASIGMGLRRVHMVAGPLYLESWAIRAVERVLCRMDNVLVAGSEYTAAAYRSLGMPGNRVHAIPYGVDTEHFRRGEDRRAQLFGCSPETFVVIMVAYVYAPKSSVHPGVGIKGHDVLLDAWQQFRREHPDSLLVLVGSGFDAPGEAHRQRLIDTCAVDADPTVRWFSSTEDVRPFYSSADLSVSPSLSENHGAALEASAMGLPLLVSDAGALPETVTRNSGWVVLKGDTSAIHQALNDAERRYRNGKLAAMGVTARAYVEDHFSTASCLEQLVDVIANRTADMPSLVAFTEQRCWTDPGTPLLGRVALGAIAPVTDLVPVIVAARQTQREPAGVALVAGESDHVLLPWPNSVRQAGRLLEAGRQVWSTVGRHDAVAVYSPGVLGTVAGLAAILRRRPLVVVAVGDPAPSVSADITDGMRERITRMALAASMKLFCRRAAVVRYVTRAALQAGYPPGRRAHSFALTDVGQLAAGLPRPHPGADKPLRVLTVVSLERPYKGVEDLVRAVANCRRSGLAIELRVAGTGRLEEEMATRARLVLGDDVTFLGHVSAEELRRTYMDAHVFVLASWAFEGTPRALLEAMAAGLPAIATRVGGSPELLEPHRLVQPHDPAALSHAIISLVSDIPAWDRSAAHNIDTALGVVGEAQGAEPRFVDAVLAAVSK